MQAAHGYLIPVLPPTILPCCACCAAQGCRDRLDGGDAFPGVHVCEVQARLHHVRWATAAYLQCSTQLLLPSLMRQMLFCSRTYAAELLWPCIRRPTANPRFLAHPAACNSRALSLHAPAEGRQLQPDECAAIYVGRAYELDTLDEKHPTKGSVRASTAGLHTLLQTLILGQCGTLPAPPLTAAPPLTMLHPTCACSELVRLCCCAHACLDLLCRHTCLTSLLTRSSKPAATQRTTVPACCWMRKNTGTRPPLQTACLGRSGSKIWQPRLVEGAAGERGSAADEACWLHTGCP